MALNKPNSEDQHKEDQFAEVTPEVELVHVIPSLLLIVFTEP